MKDMRVSFQKVAGVLFALIIVGSLFISGWLAPRLLVARLDRQFEQRIFPAELAVELADIDFNAGYRRMYQIELGGRMLPESMPEGWSGEVVRLPKELSNTDTAGTFRSVFLEEFVESYNVRMRCRNTP